MAHTLDREGVQELAQQSDAQVVEVLPRAAYEWAHLPGAVHLPLNELSPSTAATLGASRPVIVYCADLECDMSPRAARRLESLGLPQVYDYMPGKLDWLSYDLPYEGDAKLVSQAVRRDPVRLDLDERLSQVADRLLADPSGVGVAVDGDDVVQGVVASRELAEAPEDASVAQAMRVGATTVRPSEEIDALAGRMERAGVQQVVVTRSDGTLVGLYSTVTAKSPEAGAN